MPGNERSQPPIMDERVTADLAILRRVAAGWWLRLMSGFGSARGVPGLHSSYDHHLATWDYPLVDHSDGAGWKTDQECSPMGPKATTPVHGLIDDARPAVIGSLCDHRMSSCISWLPGSPIRIIICRQDRHWMRVISKYCCPQSLVSLALARVRGNHGEPVPAEVLDTRLRAMYLSDRLPESTTAYGMLTDGNQR
jgi:hypothetical protein